MHTSIIKVAIMFLLASVGLIGCSSLESPDNANKIFEFNVFLPKNNAGKGAITIGNNLAISNLLNRAEQRCNEVQMKVNPSSIVKKECGLYSCFYGYECMANSSPAPFIPSIQSNTTIDEAKTKCKDLGFKVGSEEFGKCVLRLTK